MSRKTNDYDPREGKGNYGPGGFSDMYDNGKMKSVDHDQHPGGVTGIPFEEDMDIQSMRAGGRENVYFKPDQRMEPARDADLGFGSSGTAWNWHINNGEDYTGKGPKDWKLSDERLKERVCEVLYHSHDVDPSEMEIKVEDRVVYLSGKIRSKGMKNVAEDLIASIPGVEDVFTRLKIQNTDNFQLSEKALNEARSTDKS